jgi:hypothetical protein
MKPIHARPSLYAYYFEALKEIALKYGYNLVLHGSLNRDLDLIAIPWQEEIGDKDVMIDEFVKYLGGKIHYWDNEQRYEVTHHGRMWYAVDLNRGGYQGKDHEYTPDPQYYLDISVIPALKII